MQRKDHIDAFGGTMLVGFSAMMGLNQVMVKLVNAGLDPVFQAGLRSVCAFPIILIFALLMKRRLSIRDGSLIPGIFCGTFFAIEFVLLFQALDFTSVARASVMFYTMPFWVALGAHFLIPGERLTPVRLLGLAMAVVGVGWALLDKAPEAGNQALLGDLMCLVGATFWAGIALLVRTTNLGKSSPEMQLLYQLSVSSIILLAITPFIGPLVREMTPAIAAIFSVQVLLVVCVGFLSWFWVLSIYPASNMASFGFLAPLFGVAFGWLILDEPVTVSLLGALVLVGAGIVLVNRRVRTLESDSK